MYEQTWVYISDTELNNNVEGRILTQTHKGASQNRSVSEYGPYDQALPRGRWQKTRSSQCTHDENFYAC